jgi:hypothetical protein
MNITLEISKKHFKIWRQVFADILIIHVGFLFFFVLPFCLPMAGYVVLFSNNPEHFVGELQGMFVLYFFLFFMGTIAFFLVALRERTRLPICMQLTDKNFFVLMDKTGTQWKIRYASCRFADSFVRCFIGSYFGKTMSRGITIYIPPEHLDGFRRGFGENGNQAELSFHFPIDSENEQEQGKQEIVSFLESKNCRRIPPVSANKMLLFLFSPAVLFWIHGAAALLLHEQIGDYGVFGLVLVGIGSGTVVAYAAITIPYTKIEYLRRKGYVTLCIRMLIALSIGCPIYLWNIQQALQPSLFVAVLVALLFYVESYLWIYCLLKHER